MRTRWIYVVLAVVFGASATVVSARPLTLGSGKSVDVLSIDPLPPLAGLRLTYRTLVPPNDPAQLRREVDEIWDRFVVDAERSGQQTAIIHATVGGSATDALDFSFEKMQGVWRTHESAERARTKLDAAFVREFMARLDWAYDHNDMNALLLYLAADWSVTITNPHDSVGTQTIDRANFAALTHDTFARIKDFEHHREILNVIVGDDGTTARVQSRETERSTIKDRTILLAERSTDLLELRGDVMLLKKSASVVESQTEGRSD